MNTLQRRLIALACGLLAACGGGGGSDGPPPVPPPTNLSFPITDTIYTADITIAPNVPTYQGSVAQWSVNPALPTGLAVHPLVGAIFGTPTATAPRTTYTVTGSNSSGFSNASVTITVVAPPRFVYAVCDDGTIALFSDELATGHLRRRGFMPAGANETGPERIVVHPNQRFLYVTNLATNNISVYTIAPSNGALTPGTPVDAGLGQHAMAIDPAGKFAYVSSRISDEIRIYSIAPTTGELSPVGQPVNSPTQPSAVAMDATGKHLFVALHGDPTTAVGSALAVYDVDAMTGAITLIGSPFSLDLAGPVGIAVDAIKTELYVTEQGSNNVAALHFDATTGAITKIGDHAVGLLPSSVSGLPTGKFVYVCNTDPNAMPGSISLFKVEPSNGNLTAMGSIECSLSPSSIKVDPTGRFAYVVAHGASDLTQFEIDPATGALTVEDNFQLRPGPVDVAIVTAPHVQTQLPGFVYTTNAQSNDVSSFAINPGTGDLTEILPTVSPGLQPISIAADPLQRFVYVICQTTSTISVYSPSATTGVLFEIAPQAAVFGHPTHVTVDPSGRFVYITTTGQVHLIAAVLLSYSIDAGTGAFSPIDNKLLDPHANWVETDPTGQFLYVACSGPGPATIRTFRLPLDTGIPIDVDSDPAPAVSSLGFHPSGKYLYATLKGAVSFTIYYTINVVTGELTQAPDTVSPGVEPVGVTLSRDGHSAYVAYTNTLGHGHVAFFHVDPDTGALLLPAELSSDGTHPTALAIDPTGRFLYVTNNGSNNVSVMTIDQGSGQLTIGTPKACGLSPSSILVLGTAQ